MGAFDKETQLKNATEFDPEQPFELFKGEYMGNVKSAEYGDNTKAKVWAGPQGSIEGAAKEYVVFGVMADQIGRQGDGDFPATVKIGKDGRANVLVKVG